MAKTSTALADRTPIEGLNTPIIITMPIKNLYLAAEAPKGADLQVRDSTRGSPLTDAELKASIYTHGIIQPLIWKEIDGRYYVVAGNRRLRFLREIFADTLDSQIATQNVDDFDGDWREIAMDTNLSLPPHLVERYENIVMVTKDLKLSPEDARLRFGMTTRQFAQVMALGNMSPTIRKAWKDADIDAKTAQLFTLESDHKEQDRIFAAAIKNHGRVNEWFVRERIIPANQRDAGKLVAFVGVDACKKAKIVKQEDLFATSHTVTDLKMLNKLAGDKLDEKMKELCTDRDGVPGWAWAMREDKIDGSKWEYGSIEPADKPGPNAIEKKALDEINARLADDDLDSIAEDALFDARDRIEEAIKSRGFTPAQRAKAGCFLKISSDGDMVVEYGKVKPAQKKSVAASERPKSTAAAKPKKPGEITLTNALAERLSGQLQKAGAEALKMDHAVASAAIIAAIACGGHILDIRVGGTTADRKKTVFADIFSGALNATPQQREAMFAEIAAQAISIQVFNGSGKMPLDDEGLVELFEAMNGSRVTKAVFANFDAKDYFASVSSDAIIEAVRCSMGDEHAGKVAKMKKPDAAKFAAANLKDYLPPQLRTEHYTGPVEAAKKDKKPKPVKKAPAKKRRK